MFNILASSVAALAFCSTATAAVIPRASTDDGCRVHLQSTLTNPSDPGEIILYKTLIKWNNSTGTGFSSSYCDWTNTTKAPFSVLFYYDTIPNYETQEALEAVLDTWNGTWLISSTTTPNSGVTGDYKITDVTCS